MLKLKPEISPHSFMCSNSRLGQLPTDHGMLALARTVDAHCCHNAKTIQNDPKSDLYQIQFEGPLMISTETIFVVLWALGQCSQGPSNCILCSAANKADRGSASKMASSDTVLYGEEGG